MEHILTISARQRSKHAISNARGPYLAQSENRFLGITKREPYGHTAFRARRFLRTNAQLDIGEIETPRELEMVGLPSHSFASSTTQMAAVITARFARRKQVLGGDRL